MATKKSRKNCRAAQPKATTGKARKPRHTAAGDDAPTRPETDETLGLFLKKSGKFHTTPMPQYLKDFNAANDLLEFGLGFTGTSHQPSSNHQAPAYTSTTTARHSLSQPTNVIPNQSTTPTPEPDRDELQAIAGDSLQTFLSAVLGPSGVPAEPDPTDAPKPNQPHALFVIKHSGPGGWPPRSFSRFLAEFKKNPARACYVATATVTMGTARHNDTKPALRHGSEHFVEQLFFVLDDIGHGPTAKCNHDDLPELFKNPTTIVETSPGNYQYAYRWIRPIKDRALAEEIIRAIYAAGETYGWDSGGALPIKFVRLPVGVNGKRAGGNKEDQKDNKGFADSKTWFPCRLAECHPERTFEPIDMALAIGHDVNAPENKAGRALSHMHRKGGEEFVSCGGVVDPFLENLHRVGEVIGESPGGIYKEVKCPWADKHTDKNANTAGYKPIGVLDPRKGEDSICLRHFKCFHDSCAKHTTRVYIDYMEEFYKHIFISPTPVFDTCAKLAAKWVLVASSTKHKNGAYVRLTDGVQWSIPQFMAYHSKKAPNSKATIGKLFHSSDLRKDFDRLELRPDIKELTFRDSDGHLVLNTFRRIPLKSVPREPGFMNKWLANHVRIFGDASDAILDGWAYKYQHPEWTGYAELGIGQIQGTGRTSLVQTYLEMWRPEYVGFLPANRLNMPWGNHQTKLLVIVNEVRASEDTKFVLAEKFKEDIDTTPGRRMDVNTKGGAILEAQRVFAHWIMFSNHVGAIYVEESDRRWLISDNGHNRMSEEDLADFWEGYWKKDIKYSRTQLHHFLMDRDLSHFKPNGDAPRTEMRAMMIGKTSLVGTAVDAILDNWLEYASARGISDGQMMEVLNRCGMDRIFVGSMPSNWKKQALAHLKSRTVQNADYWQVREGTDNRKWVDAGKSREKPSGPARAWCVKQNVRLIQSLLETNMRVDAIDVDWERLVNAVDAAVTDAGGD